MSAIYRVLKGDGYSFSILIGEDDLPRHALALARAYHARGDDAQVWRIADSGLALCVPQGDANEDFSVF